MKVVEALQQSLPALRKQLADMQYDVSVLKNRVICKKLHNCTVKKADNSAPTAADAVHKQRHLKEHSIPAAHHTEPVKEHK